MSNFLFLCNGCFYKFSIYVGLCHCDLKVLFHGKVEWDECSAMGCLFAELQ